jgi:metal-responsive CopG/Arc/MetJ family transcriptional regulator
MEEKKSRYELQLPESLKKSFEAAARTNDRMPSQLIRDFMREYIRKNAQGDLLKRLPPTKKQ